MKVIRRFMIFWSRLSLRGKDAPWPFVAALLAFALYAYTAAPSLTWAHAGADGGDLIVAAMTWGVPHPSGYPSYILLARLFALLPLGSIARRFTLFSACAAACALGLMCAVTLRILRRTTQLASWREHALALGVTLCLTVSPVLWSQAIITEVYALNALFCALCLYLSLGIDNSSSIASWAGLGLALGAGLGGHLTLAYLAPALALWLRPWMTGRRLLAGMFGLALGLSVYGYIPWAAMGDSPVRWGEAHTWQGLAWLVTGRLYHGYLWRLSWAHLPMRLLSWIALWGRQFTPVGLALAVTGFAIWWRQGGKARRLALSLLTSIALWSAHALGYDTADSFLYLVPAFLVTGPVLAVGACWITEKGGRLIKRYGAPTLFGALALWSMVQYGPQLSLRHDDEAEQWVRAILADSPPQSIVLTGEDRQTFALSYALWVEGHRPDLILIDGELWAQPWYAAQVRRRYPDLQAKAEMTLAEVVEMNLDRRPICLSSPRVDIEERYRVVTQGSVRCLQPLRSQ